MEKKLGYLSDNGFQFIWGHEITSPNGPTNPYPTNRKAQADDYIATAPGYSENCLGFVAFAWSPWQDAPNTAPCYESIEYLYNGNQSELPARDFVCNITPISSLLLLD
jgi:hypothetical protein